MNYIDRLSNVAVLGAAGKMGSGILLLTAIEMATQKLKNPDKNFVLNAMDISENAMPGLIDYIKTQTRKIAEKKVEQLKELFKSSNFTEIQLIEAFVNETLSIIKTTITLEPLYKSNIIFEAIAENRNLKIKIFKEIDQNSSNNPWFFTNTSSIPISLLNDEAKLEGRIIGFHFYNPPAIQRLLELITIKDNSADIKEFAQNLAKNMKKIVVNSNDTAGFIGNGHFMRDSLYAISKAEELSENMPLCEAIFTINQISQEFLMRPMGIFQLIDYVGIDVVRFILQVMNSLIETENLHSNLLDLLFENDIKGGQNSDGSQKDGFFKYENGKIVSIINTANFKYIDINEFKGSVEKFIGEKPYLLKPWKSIVKSESPANEVAEIFNEIKAMNSNGAKIAIEYARKARTIGLDLVKNGVANNADDVNTVMLTGFYHAYGPVNDFVI